jgi:hypothetical protein
MVYNGNGLWQQAGSTHTLNTAEGACADSTQYLQLGCTCAAGTITYETCDSPVEWCRNCTKVSTAGTRLLVCSHSAYSWHGCFIVHLSVGANCARDHCVCK